MGDGGSYFLGSALAMLSLSFLQVEVSFENIFIIFLVLFIPIFDMTQVLFTRFFAGVSLFYPTKGHIHHIFLRAGLSHPNTVYILYIFSILNVLLTVLTIYYRISSLLILFIVVITSLLMLLNKEK